MKILIAYDGSDCAEAALADLKRAGLPKNAEALVISISENWLPTPRSLGGVDTHYAGEWPGPLEKAELMVTHALELIRAAFPHWAVTGEAQPGSPATVVIEKADAWQPDLIVLGSRGRSGLSRLILGSVSTKVLTEARCSVRVARGRVRQAETPVRLIIGVDGSLGAEAAVRSVSHRIWPQGSAACVFAASFPAPEIIGSQMPGSLREWVIQERERVRRMVESSARDLAAAGLVASPLIKEGDPKQLLCDEAERWGADCIFVGAKNLSRIDRFLLGSVSAAVAARAHCSVEVVR